MLYIREKEKDKIRRRERDREERERKCWGKGRSDGGSRLATTAARSSARRAVAGAVESKPQMASASNSARRPAADSAPAGRWHSRSGDSPERRRDRQRDRRRDATDCQQCSGAAVTRLIRSADGRAAQEARGSAGSDAGETAATPARQRVGSAATNQRRRGGTHQRWRRAAPATGERQRGCDAMNGAVARCRPVGCVEIATTRWSFIVVHCFVMIAIVEIVVDRVGPMASESRLLFICDMSSYPDAVDISQLSVRWGNLSGP
ncbi:hypothetical protein Scep_014562 [Stephania cephalantha]|uniref:Uncharacterized protein n=1 Tax=Stephania cephalantha TaxID=152367 RepID=A0AAP0J427_9MAGN